MTEKIEIEAPSFSRVVSNALDEGIPIEEAIESLLDSEDFRETVKKNLINRARSIQRMQDMHAERRAVQAWRGGNVVTARRELIGRTFALPDGTFVEWEKATAAQHKSRADWQRRRAASISRDATLHEVAAHVIEETGVTCLGELESLTPWPELAQVDVKEITG